MKTYYWEQDVESIGSFREIFFLVVVIDVYEFTDEKKNAVGHGYLRFLRQIYSSLKRS